MKQIYCIIFGQPLQENESSLAVIFVPIFKEDDEQWQKQNTLDRRTDTLKQKYGMGHTRTVRNTMFPSDLRKSSKDLEQKVIAYNLEVENRTKVRKTDTLFIDYARMWKNVYKSQAESNTLAMYENIIEKHFTALPTTRLCDIERIHLQTLLNNAAGKDRTREQIYMTFKQVITSAVADKLFPANVAEDIFRSIERPRYKPDEKRPLTPRRAYKHF